MITNPITNEPIYMHLQEKPLVTLGSVYGCRVFVELEGMDVESREDCYLRIQKMMSDFFYTTPSNLDSNASTASEQRDNEADEVGKV